MVELLIPMVCEQRGGQDRYLLCLDLVKPIEVVKRYLDIYGQLVDQCVILISYYIFITTYYAKM